MIDNGFTPEWIQLSKEIRKETEELKKKLSEVRNQIGKLPLTPQDAGVWKDNLGKLQIPVKQINNKIDKYNLLVPILQKQMLHVQLDNLAEKALSVAPLKNVKKYTETQNYNNSNENTFRNIFDLLSDLFNKKTM